ncbi:MAG: ABC transporter ATP-binding protein [Polyangiaceae bacterium]|nr:ABC transporter ATP-binding protein [Polyangiaceae bacterium]
MIEIRDLFKYYGDRRAVGPLSATIEKGEIVGLLGLNGAGKTTTLRVLACDLLPTSGSVKVAGLDVVEQPHEVRKRIGYLPDTPPVYPEMTVEEYLRFAAKLRGVPADKLDERVGDAMELTETLAERDQRIGTLSHGFRQRVGIAQAIVHEPELVVLDEPISGLDPVQIVEMRDLVRSLGGERTVVVSSHILGEISETCDRIFVIGNGEIVASGTEAELSSRLLKGMRVELTLRVGDRAREAEALLVEVAGVDQVEAVEGVERGKGIQSFLLHAQRDVREAVAQALVGAGFGVLELSRGERELESVFLELSGPADGKKKKKKKRAAADDAPPPAPQQEAES